MWVIVMSEPTSLVPGAPELYLVPVWYKVMEDVVILRQVTTYIYILVALQNFDLRSRKTEPRKNTKKRKRT